MREICGHRGCRDIVGGPRAVSLAASGGMWKPAGRPVELAHWRKVAAAVASADHHLDILRRSKSTMLYNGERATRNFLSKCLVLFILLFYA